MSLGLSGADAGHLAVAVALTYALGFERAVRGAAAGDRVFSLIGAGSGAVSSRPVVARGAAGATSAGGKVSTASDSRSGNSSATSADSACSPSGAS